jgi:hypothetical protein
MMRAMADEPDNIVLRLLRDLRAEMRAGFAELRGDVAELKRMHAEDRSLLEDVAREVGIEPTQARLTREKFEAETRQRLDRIEAKVFPPAE